MPTFEKTIFTNLGISFINDLNSAHSKLVSATTVYSSSDLSGMSDDDIKNMTDISNKELTANCDILKMDDHQTKIRSIANNESLKQGIYIRSYATYVVDQDGNQTLFAMKVNTKPQYLAAFDGVNTNAQSYGFNVGISQTDSVMFTKLSNLSATIQDLKALDDKTTSALASKVTFDGGYIFTGNGKFVPASINDVTSKIKTTVTNGDNFDNYRDNGTYPMNNVSIRTIGGSGGLPSFENFSGDLTVTVKGNEIEQIISANNGQRFYRNLGQFWYQIARKEDLDSTQASTADNTSSLATLNNALQSKVTYSGGYIFTGNGSFVPAAINDVTSSIAVASSAASSAVSSTAQQEANDIRRVNTALSSKVSFSGGTIFTGNGSFVPAATDTVNKALNAINNGLSGVSPKPLGDSGDFYNLPLGIYFVNGNPANNPYGHACYGTAFSMGGYVQYLDQNGDAFFITPRSGGWLKYTKQSDVVTLQNQMNGVLARQSNLMQRLANIYADGSLNNLSAIAQTGGTINLTMYNTTPQNPISTVKCVYSFLTNSITINGNYTLNPGQFLWIGLEPLIPYFKGWNTSAVTIHLNNPVDYFDWDVIGDGQTWNHVELRLRQSMQGWTGYSFNSFVNTIIALSHQ